MEGTELKRTCLTCHSVKVCSTWQGFRPFIGQVSTEHGNYAKMKETYDTIAGIVANVCYIYHPSIDDPEAAKERVKVAREGRRLEAARNHMHSFPTDGGILDVRIDENNDPVPNQYNLWFAGLQKIMEVEDE